MIIDNPIVSGSLRVQNNITASNGLITGDLTVEGTLNATVEGTTATASYVALANVDGFSNVSSSLAERISSQEDFSSSLNSTFATDAELSAVSGALALSISSISTDFADITNKPTLVSSSAQFIDLTAPFTGSFTGSFYGDGSNLSGVTSYTDADTLSFINSKAVLSGSIAELTSVTASFINTGSVIIPHSFNSKNVSVSVYNSSDVLILPDQITLVDNNNIKIDFAGLTSGFAVVAKGGHIVSGSVLVPQVSTVSDTFTSATSHTITHNFNTKEVIVSVYENDLLIFPDTISTPTLDTVQITFPEPVTGRVVVVKAGHIVSGSIPFDNIISNPFEQSTLAVTASKHIVPSQDVTYDLGSPSLRFRDLYLSSASIYLGNTVLSEESVVTTASLASVLPANVISSSAQIASDISGSFTELSSSLEQRVSTNEVNISTLTSVTSSYLLNTTDTLVGDLTVTGTITAQEFHTEFVSASILYDSGSTKFGNSADDVHSMTGSLQVSGSSHYLLGNVGIGIPDPSYKFDVYGTSRFIVSRTDATNANALILSDTLTGISTPGYGTRIVGYSNGTGVMSVIGFENGGTGTNNESQLSFYTQNVAGSLTKQLLISSTGAATFSNSVTAAGATFSGTTAVASFGATSQMRIDRIGSVARIQNYDNGSAANISIAHDGGNVGIGTTSPSYKLTVKSAGNSTFPLAVTNTSNSLIGGIYQTGGGDGQIYLYNSAGAENVKISSVDNSYFNGGNVGIGTTSPSSALCVAGSVAGFGTSMQVWESGQTALIGDIGGKAATFFGTSGLSNSSIVNIYSTNAYTGQYGGEIGFGGKYASGGNVAQFAKIRSFKNDSGDGTYGGGLEFWTRPNGGPAVPRMTILGTNGNVGVGTDSPQAKLHIGNDGSNSYATLRLEGSNRGGHLDMYNGSYPVSQYLTDQSGNIYISTSGGFGSASLSYKFTILTGGNVGIGTTSPDKVLTIHGPGGGGGNIVKLVNSTGAGSSGPSMVFNGGTIGNNYVVGANIFSEGDFAIYDTSNTSKLITINPSGNVGIGTDSPSNKLTVRTGTNNNWDFFDNGTGVGVQSINDINTVYRPMTFYASSYSLNNGNVGIGTTTPSQKLEVAGGFKQSGVTRYCWSGYVAGNGAFDIDVSHVSESSFKITCVMNHYGYVYDYGCARMAIVGNGPVITVVDITNVTSPAGGSWSFSRIDNLTLRISKNAGSYGGGGYYFVEVVGHVLN